MTQLNNSNIKITPAGILRVKVRFYDKESGNLNLLVNTYVDFTSITAQQNTHKSLQLTGSQRCVNAINDINSMFNNSMDIVKSLFIHNKSGDVYEVINTSINCDNHFPTETNDIVILYQKLYSCDGTPDMSGLLFSRNASEFFDKFTFIMNPADASSRKPRFDSIMECQMYFLNDISKDIIEHYLEISNCTSEQEEISRASHELRKVLRDAFLNRAITYFTLSELQYIIQDFVNGIDLDDFRSSKRNEAFEQIISTLKSMKVSPITQRKRSRITNIFKRNG